MPVSPHTFPSYRALAIRAVDAIDEVIDQRTPASLELDYYIRDEQVFNDAKGIRHIINLFHSTVPRSNP